MLNGIRLNNFDYGLPPLDNEYRSVFNQTDNFILKYKDYITLQLNMLFGNEQEIVINANNTEEVIDIQPIKYKNILEKINVVLRKKNDITFSYYICDFNAFNDLTGDDFINELVNQDKIVSTVLSYYIEYLGKLNNAAEYKRNFICEFDVKIYDNNQLYDFWEYLSHYESQDNINTTLTNICNQYTTECIKFIKATITKLTTTQINQYWILFNNVDSKITGDNQLYLIERYKRIIDSVSVFQLHSIKTGTGLIGPNSHSYTLENNDFLLNIQDIIDKFDLLCFCTNEIDISLVNKYYTGDVILTDLKPQDDTLRGVYEYIAKTFDLYKQNIYCIQNKLFSYTLTNDDMIIHEDDTGILQWVIDINKPDDFNVLNNNKLIYIMYRDIYSQLEKYNKITNDNIVGEGSFNQLSLYDDNDTDLVYLLYNYSGSITIAPHYARKFYYQNQLLDILTPMSINLIDYQGVAIVIEDNTLDKTDLSVLYNKIKMTLEYYQSTIRHLIKVLPKSYNKEIDDTNFFKLLRSVAMELSESKYNLDEVSNGLYLNDFDIYNDTYTDGQYLRQVNNDLIYNNFGALIDLPKKSKWTNDQYRNIVTAIIKIILTGPTKDNIQDAISKFTGYKNEIYELYKERDNYLFADLKALNLTYKFAIMLTKDLNKFDDSAELYKDLIYLLTIIKPAQSLFFIYILFVDNELVEVLDNVTDIWIGPSNIADDIPEVKSKLIQLEGTYGYKFDDDFLPRPHILSAEKPLPLSWRDEIGWGKDANDIEHKYGNPQYLMDDVISNNIGIINFSDIYNNFFRFYFRTTGRINPNTNMLDPDGYLEGRLNNERFILYGNGTLKTDNMNFISINKFYEIIDNNWVDDFNNKSEFNTYDKFNQPQEMSHTEIDLYFTECYKISDNHYFKTTGLTIDNKVTPDENEEGILNNQFMLYGTEMFEGEKITAIIQLQNRIYSDDELQQIEISKQNGWLCDIQDVISISCDKINITIAETAQFTSNFNYVSWTCNNGIIDENGLYTPILSGTDTIKCLSVFDNKYTTKQIIVN